MNEAKKIEGALLGLADLDDRAVELKPDFFPDVVIDAGTGRAVRLEELIQDELNLQGPGVNNH